MRKLGFVRKVDAIGRLTIPKEIRNILNCEQVGIILEDNVCVITRDIADICRNFDSSGRLIIPKEIRKRLNIIDSVSLIEFFVDDNRRFLLKVYNNTCAICKNKDNLIEINNNYICEKCAKQVYKVMEEKIWQI